MLKNARELEFEKAALSRDKLEEAKAVLLDLWICLCWILEITMKKNIDLKILFVCMSNTGRSPLAEAVLKSKLQEQQILEGYFWNV